MSQSNRSKRGAPSATFGHAGYKVTVEMIKPRIMADGQPERQSSNRPWPRFYPHIKQNIDDPDGVQRIVTGYFTNATFRVTGWRHPIEFCTIHTVPGPPATIQRITIGTDEALGTRDYQAQDQISLDGLPLGKLLAASLEASAHTATIKLHRSSMTFASRKVTRDHVPIFVRLGDASDPQIGATHPGDAAPMKSKIALRRIAKLYRDAVAIERVGRGYKTIAKWIEQQTGGKRKAATAQQMIAMARAAGYLDQSRPKRIAKHRRRIKK